MGGQWAGRWAAAKGALLRKWEEGRGAGRMMRRGGRFPFPLARGREVGGASGGAEAAAGARSAAMGTRGLREAVVELEPGQARGAEASGTGDTSDSRDEGASVGGARWGVGGGAVGQWCSDSVWQSLEDRAGRFPAPLEAAAAAAISPGGGRSGVVPRRDQFGAGFAALQSGGNCRSWSWAVQCTHVVKPA